MQSSFVRCSFVRFSVIVISFGFLASCSSSTKENPDKASEVPNKEVIKTDLPPNELLEKSKRLYENALYTSSVESFQSLKDAYSPGPYAEFAEIKMADSNFEMRKFDAAAANYEEFIKTHPSSKSIPYATLKAGRSYELSNKGIGRDLAPLEKAREYYEKLIEQYPESVYTFAARKYYQDIAGKISEHDEFVREFYRKKDKEDAAKAREDHFNKKIAPVLEKANYKLKEEEELKVKAKAKISTPEEIAEEETKVQSNTVAITRKVPPPFASSDDTELSTSYRIQSVKCLKTGAQNIIVYLNKEFTNEEFLEKNEYVTSNNGLLEFTIPEASSRALELDCFAEKDLKISENAQFALINSGRANLISLANPPRLLLSFE